ncbi:MAG: substrate-binding domain-containing protein [Candidatus Marinimicrobia bacterium]|nr:substrate-binding domain-containing protein [Candidatus Neomarinimicrobiota bacterium]
MVLTDFKIIIYKNEKIFKKIAIILFFTGCGIVDQFNKSNISVDSTSSSFMKSVVNNLDPHITDKYSFEYSAEFNCVDLLLENKTESCISSQKFTKEDSLKLYDSGLIPRQALLGADGVIAVVHNSNTVEIIEEMELRKTFTGDIQFWDEVGGFSTQIITYIQKNEIGDLFKSLVLKDDKFFDLAIEVDNTDSMIVSILDDFNGIGFVRVSDLPKIITKIKMLSIAYPEKDFIAIPLYNNILSGEYPFAHQFYLQTIQKNNDVINPLLKSFSSSSTKKIIKNAGFIPIMKNRK